MFESLSEKLQGVFKRLKGRGRLTEKHVEEALREIKLALLDADVNFKVVRSFVNTLKEKAVGQELFEELNPAQTIVKVVHSELIDLLGGEVARLTLERGQRNKLMLVGLQGSGKTTTCAKIARYFKKNGFSPLLVALDTYRPAAIDQLEKVAEQVNVPCFSLKDGSKPEEIARRALRHAEENVNNLVIFDTAGRLAIDDEMMGELERLKSLIVPNEILLVVDAMTGQDAVSTAEEFHRRLNITGAVMTKLDSDARGGATLSIRHVAQVPIVFAGTSEKLDGIELFHPDRMAGRILGMGDVLSLIEKVEAGIDRKKAEELQRKMLRPEEFNFEDMLDQFKQLKRLGSIENVIKMVPGMGGLAKQIKDANIDESQLGKVEAIIKSMTAAERQRPSILNGSRRRRIAEGSGVTVQQVNELVKSLGQMKQMMKQMGFAGGGRRRGRGMRNLPF